MGSPPTWGPLRFARPALRLWWPPRRESLGPDSPATLRAVLSSSASTSSFTSFFSRRSPARLKAASGGLRRYNEGLLFEKRCGTRDFALRGWEPRWSVALAQTDQKKPEDAPPPPCNPPPGITVAGAPQPTTPAPGAPPPATSPAPAPEVKTVKFTHYCNCKVCCGKSPGDAAYGITADGSTAAAGTLAAPKAYAFGTTVTWTDPKGNAHDGVIHDRGGAIKGNRIDIWVPTHAEALRLGTYTVDATFTTP